jgi:hypothetical protein
MLAFNNTFYFGAYFTEQYFTRFYTYFLIIFTIHIINIMSQHHEQQQERSRLKNQSKALYQATRRANPVVRSLEQSSDTARKRLLRLVGSTFSLDIGVHHIRSRGLPLKRIFQT